jgi:prolyl oligopeptidase
MKKIAVIVSLALSSCSTESRKEVALPPAPETPVKMVSEKIYGHEINDPYRYLEDIKDPEVEKWYRAHAERSRNILNAIAGREGLIEKMRDFDSRKSTRAFSLQITDNDRYFYLKQTPADETGKLFYRDGLSGEESLLFDPLTYDTLSKRQFVISAHYPSLDGKKIAFEIAPNGSESSELIVLDVESKQLFPEKIDRCWFASCAWMDDGKSFLYNRLNSADVHDMEREKNSKIFMHIVGTDPSKDKEIFSRAKNPDLGIREDELPFISYDHNNQYIFSFASSVDNRLKVWYAPASELKKEKIAWKKLFALEDEVYNFQVTDKEIFVYTPKGAPRFNILRMPLKDANLSKAQVAVPQYSDRTINNMTLNSEGLYYSTTRNGVMANVYRLPLSGGEIQEINLPIAAGSVGLSSKGHKFPEVWMGMGGWTQDFKRYRYLQDKNDFRAEMLSSEAKYPEYADLVVEELMVKSHDGVEVPLSLIYKKGLKKDGTNPVLILGYGAYGISINPFFSPAMLLWTDKGGIFAVAHVRGGGELGDEWYQSGKKVTKKNTWKDLIATAEHLVSDKYTSPKKIVINGGSAGGILIGRAMTERPDLFAAAIPEVGCMNPLRGEDSPNGPVNVPEFGTVKDSIEFLALMEMDSYLHVKDGESYPATMITAGMNDPRVIAWQPGKFAARLTAANKSDKPVLFLTDFEAGHGIGDSKTKQFESLSDLMAFGLWQTGHPEFQLNDPIVKDPEIKLQ